ncbi:MAG: hypothetical protein WCT53_03730 [Candidatus Gracilibacteria bacterium]|jgi:hypothetical protein
MENQREIGGGGRKGGSWLLEAGAGATEEVVRASQVAARGPLATEESRALMVEMGLFEEGDESRAE